MSKSKKQGKASLSIKPQGHRVSSEKGSPPSEVVAAQTEAAKPRAKAKSSKAVSAPEENIVSPAMMNFLGWGGGVFFFVYSGLTAFVAYGSQSVMDALAAFVYAVCGFLLFPPGRKALEKLTGKPWGQKKLLRAYFLLASMGFVLTFFSMKTNAPQNAPPGPPPESPPTHLAPVKQDFYWGYIGTDGLYKIKPAFDTATAFCRGRARVQSDGAWKTIDSKGVAISASEDIAACNDSAAHKLIIPAFDSLTGKYGFRSVDGAWVIYPQFDEAGKFQPIQP